MIYFEDSLFNLVDCLDKYGNEYSIFAAACRLGNLDIIKMIDKTKINVNDNDGLLLKLICNKGNLKILKYIDNNMKIDLYSYRSDLIKIACHNNNLPMIEYLLPHKSTIKKYIKSLLYKTDIYNKGLLDIIESNDKKIIIFKYFIENNYINIHDDNEKLFIYCCLNNYENIVTYI